MPAPFQASSLEALTRTTSLRSQPPAPEALPKDWQVVPGGRWRRSAGN